MKISVIIPALNEEKNLPLLLESLAVQTMKDFEIVIADAGSTDSTCDLARAAGAKVVPGGLPGPGRNAGARASSGDFIVFLDADVKVDPEFIEQVYTEMDDRYLDLATCRFVPLSDLRLDKLIHRYINMEIRMTRRTDPKTFGFGIFCSRRLFNKIDGFDETVTLAEDCDFVRRGSKYRPMEYLEDPTIYVSVRRYEKEGRFNYAKKGINIWLHRSFKGEIRDNSIEYEFAKYDAADNEHRNTLDRLEKVLIDTELRFKEYKASRKQRDRRIKSVDFEEYRKKQMALFEKGFRKFFD